MLMRHERQTWRIPAQYKYPLLLLLLLLLLLFPHDHNVSPSAVWSL